jgi:16S rRNA G966 N2-methylase RsmD
LNIEVNESPRVNFGDTWQLGQHTLTCCDSSTWNAPQAKLAFADPPYNAGMADWDISFEWKHDWLIDKADLVVVTPGDE